MNWMDEAACKGHTHLFFPVARERPPQRMIREAQAFAMCSLCPVRIECREASTNESGIWGGRLLEDGKVVSPLDPTLVTL